MKMSITEAKEWIDQLRDIAHDAAAKAERARERLAHAEAQGDEILAACLRKQAQTAEKAAQDVHVACDQMEDQLPG